jgi:deoxyribose-phosphate aldolase
MDAKEALKHVDHTKLRQEAKRENIKRLRDISKADNITAENDY